MPLGHVAPASIPTGTPDDAVVLRGKFQLYSKYHTIHWLIVTVALDQHAKQYVALFSGRTVNSSFAVVSHGP